MNYKSKDCKYNLPTVCHVEEKCLIWRRKIFSNFGTILLAGISDEVAETKGEERLARGRAVERLRRSVGKRFDVDFLQNFIFRVFV